MMSRACVMLQMRRLDQLVLGAFLTVECLLFGVVENGYCKIGSAQSVCAARMTANISEALWTFMSCPTALHHRRVRRLVPQVYPRGLDSLDYLNTARIRTESSGSSKMC